MRHLDRHGIALLIEYGGLLEASAEARAARSAEVEEWLKVAYDRATEAGRVLFVELQGEASGEWPWNAVTPIQVDLSGQEDDVVRAIDRAPAALILLVLRDTTEPEFTDPDNWVGDGVEWIPLRDALLSWDPETIESYMSTGIWSPPIIKTDASEPQKSDAGAGGTNGGGVTPGQETGGVTPPQPTPTPAPTVAPSVWRSWQLWAAVGVAAVATYGLTRVRRG